MTKSLGLRLLLALGAAWGVVGTCAAKPNIVFILADDMGYGDLGITNQNVRAVQGLPSFATPNIDSIAQAGVRFNNMYTGAPNCSPSRNVMLTGFHQGHTIFDHASLTLDIRPGEMDKTWAQTLQQADYETGFFGKWHLGGVTPNVASIRTPSALPTGKGFETAYGPLIGTFRQTLHWESDGNGSMQRYFVPAEPTWTGSGAKVQFGDDLIASRAIDFIRTKEAGTQPFIAYVPFMAPHIPVDQVPKNHPYVDAPWPQVQRDYAGMMWTLDQHVGQILGAINDPNNDGNTSDSVASNTIVIFASDNGALASGTANGFQPGFFGSNLNLSGAKAIMTEGGIRTPFFVKWTGTIAPGTQNDSFVGTFADLMPTFAEIAGQDVPLGIDGRSMYSDIVGGPAGERPDLEFWVQKYEIGGANPGGWAVRVGDWKFMKRRASNLIPASVRLYNIAADPRELFNQANNRPDIVAALQAIGFAEGGDREPTGPAFDDPLLVESKNTYFTQYKNWAPVGGSTDFAAAANWGGGTQQGVPGEPEALYWNTGPADNWLATMVNAEAAPRQTALAEDASVMAIELAGPGGEMRLVVPAGRRLTARNGVRISAGGTVQLHDGELNTIREIDVRPGGKLAAQGVITGQQAVIAGIPEFANKHLFEPKVIDAGEINIGDGATAGILTINGEYEQRTTGVLHFDLFGRSGVAGVDFDKLAISRTAVLGGLLDIALAPGVQLQLGDMFPILTAAGGITGSFSTASMPLLLPGLSWNISYSPTSVSLSVIEQTLTNLTIASGQALGSSVTIGAGQSVDLSGFLRVGLGAGPGNLTINSGGLIHVGGTTTIDSAGVLTLAGGTVQTAAINKVVGGSLVWSSGLLDMTGNFAVAPSQGLGAALTLAHGQTLHVAGVLSISPGTLAIDAGGVVQAGSVTVANGSTLTLSGGALRTNSLTAAPGTFHWTGGTLEFLGDVTIAAGQSLGASVTLGSQQTLQVDHDLFVGNGANPGALTIGAGGAAIVGNQTVVAPAGALTLAGGSLTTGRLVKSPGGTFDWQSGRLRFTGDLSIASGSDLGAAVVVSNGRTLEVANHLSIAAGTLSVDVGGLAAVDGATTIGNGGVLTLAGGKLSTASLVQQGNGQLTWTGGTLAFTGSLSVAPGGDLGAAPTIGSGRALEVAHNLTIPAGGLLTLAGGAITAESLSAQGGSFAWTTGQLHLTSNLLIATGQTFENLSLGANQTLTAANLQVADAFNSGVLSITSGAAVNVSGAITIKDAGVLELDGGSLTASTIARDPAGSLRFWAGSLTLSGPDALLVGTDGLMGAAVTISPDRSLAVAAPIVVVAGGRLSDYGGQLSTSLLQLDGGEFYAPDFAGIGAVAFNSGKISMSADFALTAGGPLGAEPLIGADHTLDVIGALAVGQSGGSQVNLVIGAGGVVNAGAGVTVRAGHMLALDGGRLSTSSLAGEAGAAFIWNSGTLHFTGDLTVAAAGDLGAAVVLGGGQTLEVANQLHINAGSLTLNAGGESASGVTSVAAAGAVHLTGGKLSTASLSLAPGATFDWQFGELHFTGDQAIAAGDVVSQALGGSLQIGPTRHLSIAGTATLNAPLTLAGGILSVGQLVNAGLLTFNSGTLNLTGGDLLVDVGGAFGQVLTVQANQTLHVSGATFVAPGALATVANGATFSSRTIVNSGEITLGGALATLESVDGLTNQGSLRGNGRIGGPVVNAWPGQVIVDAGARLNFLGPTWTNAGQMLATGTAANPAELAFGGPVANVWGGQINASRARVFFNAGVANEGSLTITGGENQVHGTIANTGEIVVTGGATVTFYDDIAQNGALSVARAGDLISTAIFLGNVTGAGGATGAGNVFFEGDVSPGNSPALVSYAGNVFLGAGSHLKIELGGTFAGVDHDAIAVAGTFTLGGVLDVSLIDGFSPTGGQNFTIIDSQGGLAGAFGALVLPYIPTIEWSVERTATSLILHTVTAPVSADFDGDGRVTGNDFLAWQRGLGTPNALRSQGDANGDFLVNAGDLATWRSHFGGASAAASVQSVPEPASLGLVAIAALIVFRRRVLLASAR